MLNSSSADNFPDFLVISRSWNHKLESSCCSFGTVFLQNERTQLIKHNVIEVVTISCVAFWFYDRGKSMNIHSIITVLPFVACGRAGTQRTKYFLPFDFF